MKVSRSPTDNLFEAAWQPNTFSDQIGDAGARPLDLGSVIADAAHDIDTWNTTSLIRSTALDVEHDLADSEQDLADVKHA